MYGVKWGKIRRIGYVASPHSLTKGLPITIRACDPVRLSHLHPYRTSVYLDHPIRNGGEQYAR